MGGKARAVLRHAVQHGCIGTACSSDNAFLLPLQLAEQAGGKRTQRRIEGIDTAFSLQQSALNQGLGPMHALGNPLPVLFETVQQGFRPETRG